jgi:hypothetical protein
MARSRQERSPNADRRAPGGTGGFAGQIGLFETGNGLPFGPLEIALALLAAILIYPITRVVGILRRR